MHQVKMHKTNAGKQNRGILHKILNRIMQGFMSIITSAAQP